ncbi:hypothetical protein DQ04_09371020 [Trypanosoma grayi]|uniref:hypothetical protein n=1 Tax=Trypanosoma grayi TaxID=71804 RepID=UPI0004F41A26|nr:hypothetical protein DQ04_09371020 [Trypanosoma grayi]KEG07580.1 hypothetical protein DQ04_09371020 [Trypanosoma grayi]
MPLSRCNSAVGSNLNANSGGGTNANANANAGANTNTNSGSGSSNNNNNNGNTTHKVLDSAPSASSRSPTPALLNPIVGGDSPGPMTLDVARQLSSTVDTPNFGHNGISGIGDWTLTPSSLSLQLPCYATSPRTGIMREPSLVSSTSQRYCHDPYSLSGSQRLSPQSHPISTTVSPHNCALSPLAIGLFDENATGPLTITTIAPAVPKERNEPRSRRKGRPGEHARNTKPLADVPPPTTMRYLPPPPPCADSVSQGILSPDALHRIGQRWYERTAAAESSYLWRIPSTLWVHTFSVQVAQQQHQPFITARPTLGCPRMELQPNYPLWQWLGDAEQWWETMIRPLTGAHVLPPPPYIY